MAMSFCFLFVCVRLSVTSEICAVIH